MRPLVLLWGCLVLPGYGALVGPKEIRGFEGDTVSLQCTYGEELRKSKKYWCKRRGLFFPRCSKTIYAGEDGQERTVDRVSIQDSPQDLSFNVTLRKLTLQDTGSYWCGVNLLGFDETFLVSLLVSPGTSHSATPPDATSTEDTSLVHSSSSSKSSVSPPMVRILAPVLVLLTLLLAAGLAILGRYMLQWRKKAQLAVETQRNEKVHLSHLTSEEEEAPFQDLERDKSPGPPLHMSEEELMYSKFISV